MKKILSIAAVVSLVACSENKEPSKVLAAVSENNYSTEGKNIVVYTTADTANYRLTPTDTMQFADFGQPKETQPCIFVDPSKTFQTFTLPAAK